MGCAPIQHHWNAGSYAGEALSTRHARGSARLADELRFDPTIFEYVAEHGEPDFLYVVDRHTLYLFHTEKDRAARFERVLIEPSELHELGRIPGSLLTLLPTATQKRLERSRAVAQRRAQNKARRMRSANARRPTRSPGPGAPAPGGAYLNAFEPESLIARLREPVTAADPGVTGWRQVRVRGGGVSWHAEMGRTRYEVSRARVAFTTPLPTSRGNLPRAARVAIQQLNSAIFAARSERVTKLALELAQRAASDRSGRTHFAERVAGRTLRIGRLRDRELFSYSIHP